MAADNGRLLAISGKEVLVINTENGKRKVLIDSELAAPIGLAVDSNKNIYVSDWKDQMCVKVFSPEGKYLRRIGMLGGRPLRGKYNPKWDVQALGNYC